MMQMITSPKDTINKRTHVNRYMNQIIKGVMIIHLHKVNTGKKTRAITTPTIFTFIKTAASKIQMAFISTSMVMTGTEASMITKIFTIHQPLKTQQWRPNTMKKLIVGDKMIMKPKKASFLTHIQKANTQLTTKRRMKRPIATKRKQTTMMKKISPKALNRIKNSQIPTKKGCKKTMLQVSQNIKK